jgi:sugar phosphate isomerase/epimerase
MSAYRVNEGGPSRAEEMPMFSRLGVCSWSLRPTSIDDLIALMGRTGLTSVQLALDPFRTDPKAWPIVVAGKRFADAGISIASGMMTMKGEDYSTLRSIEFTGGVRPDATWKENLLAARENAETADRLGVSVVTFHAGFMPHDKGDPLWTTIRDRVLMVADCFARFDISVALETGQEPPEVLIEFLNEIDNPMVGINFDPANIILYGNGDPVDAFRAVAPFVDQLHIKDADPSPTPGEWGREVVVGTGAVDWRGLLDAVREQEFLGNAMIEREAGEERVADIRRAKDFLDAALAGVRA